MAERRVPGEAAREREALIIAHAELVAISRLGGFKKSVGTVVAKIEALVPKLRNALARDNNG